MVGIWSFIFLLRRIGFKSAIPSGMQINNIMAQMHAPGRIDCKSFHEAYPESVIPLQGRFHGYNVVFPNTKVKCTVFGTGNISLTGAKRQEQVLELMGRVAEMVYRFTL